MSRVVKSIHNELIDVAITHDNGGRPFKVNIYKYNINILKLMHNDYIPIMKIESYDNVFIGESVEGECSDGRGPNFYGNTVLIKVDDKNYIFVGHLIYSFILETPIKYYWSPVGNNDVPYAYGITKDDKIYLFSSVYDKPHIDVVELDIDDKHEYKRIMDKYKKGQDCIERDADPVKRLKPLECNIIQKRLSYEPLEIYQRPKKSKRTKRTKKSKKFLRFLKSFKR